MTPGSSIARRKCTFSIASGEHIAGSLLSGATNNGQTTGPAPRGLQRPSRLRLMTGAGCRLPRRPAGVIVVDAPAAALLALADHDFRLQDLVQEGDGPTFRVRSGNRA